MIWRRDRYWCVLLTYIIFVDVLMEELLRVDVKQGYERGPQTSLADWDARMFSCEP